ncbi:hypothetical protein DFS34DRAFT_652578 [Phlyctochytrium arcticum]|nr:hypothetical protein DFS34DRAFT_652578 [Phlyctochytrium arcticum]
MSVANGIFLRVHQNPKVAERVSEVTVDKVAAVLNSKANRRKAAAAGIVSEEDGTGRARELLRFAEAGVCNMIGPNSKRDNFRKKVDAMSKMMGSPSIFFTLSPNPHGSLISKETKGFLENVLAILYHRLPKARAPHIHILMWVKPADVPITPEDTDRVISAEIPDRESDPLLYQTVTTAMLH